MVQSRRHPCRPEGRDGPLVRTLASHGRYYERWAKGWEFQALLKARPLAGDRELGDRFVALTGQRVWQASAQPDFVEAVQRMRRRVEEHVPAGEGLQAREVTWRPRKACPSGGAGTP